MKKKIMACFGSELRLQENNLTYLPGGVFYHLLIP